MGRPHLADALVAKKIVKSRDEAFVDLLHNESRFYVSHAAPTPVEAIALIRRAGGVAVIAHPFASLRGHILKAHGSSTRRAIKSAICAGNEMVKADMNQLIEADIARANELLAQPAFS